MKNGISGNTKSIKPKFYIDLGPIHEALIQSANAIAKGVSDPKFLQMVEEMERRERDRRWANDPMLIKDRFLIPWWNGIKGNIIETLEWIIWRLR